MKNLSVLDRLRAEKAELTLEERVLRGQEVERMMKDGSVFREIWDEVELQTLQLWRDSDDQLVRERSWAVVNALKEVQRVLHKIMDDGTVAEDQLKRQNATS